MASAQPNPSFNHFRGRIGNLIFRLYRGRTVVSQAPDYSKRPRNANQKASSRQFAVAVAYADATLADPVKRAAYARRARRTGLTLRGFIIRDYMKNGPV
jgi:hypothetical protein